MQYKHWHISDFYARICQCDVMYSIHIFIFIAAIIFLTLCKLDVLILYSCIPEDGNFSLRHVGQLMCMDDL